MGREVGQQRRNIVLTTLAAAALLTGCLAGISSPVEIQRRRLEDEAALLPSVEEVRQVKTSWQAKMAASTPEAWDAALLASSVSSASCLCLLSLTTDAVSAAGLIEQRAGWLYLSRWNSRVGGCKTVSSRGNSITRC
jgi:hypothetical protein